MMDTNSFSVADSAIVANTLVKRTSLSSLFYALLMILVGLSLFVIAFYTYTTSPSLSMSFLVVSAILLLLGVFRLFWRRKKLFYLPTGSEAKEFNLFFDLKELPLLKEMISTENFSLQPTLLSLAGGNIRLQALITSDYRFAAVQLYQFVPYIYEPVTTVHLLQDDKAETFISFFQACQK